MIRLLPAALALSVAAAAPFAAARPAAAARAPTLKGGTPLAITVTNDRFTPDRLTLKRGTAYTLTIRNASDRRHNLSAPQFFDEARVNPADSGWLTDDKVDLKPGQTARIRLVAPTTPNAVYRFRSTNLLDAAEKLKGEIYVR